MKKLILASKSPARKKLLQRIGIPFHTYPSSVHEEPFKKSILDPVELAKTLAKAKAQNVFQHHPQSIVIGSDQVVRFQGKILGKPRNKELAQQFLSSLQGQTHELINGVCLYSPEGIKEWIQVDLLTMKSLTEKEIMNYIEKDNPLFCAGSYRLESLGIALFEKISSQDHTSITGLPLLKLCKELKKLGLDPLSSPPPRRL